MPDELSKFFAQQAAAFFKEHPRSTIYTDGELAAGKLLGIRYGDDVLVVKIDISSDPVIHKSLFGKQ